MNSRLSFNVSKTKHNHHGFYGLKTRKKNILPLIVEDDSSAVNDKVGQFTSDSQSSLPFSILVFSCGS